MSITNEIERINIASASIKGDLVRLGAADGTEKLDDMANKIKVLEKPTGTKGQLVGFIEDDVLGAVDAQNSGADSPSVSDCHIEVAIPVSYYVNRVAIDGNSTDYHEDFIISNNDSNASFDVPGRNCYTITLFRDNVELSYLNICAGDGEYIFIDNSSKWRISFSQLKNLLSLGSGIIHHFINIGDSVFAKSRSTGDIEFVYAGINASGFATVFRKTRLHMPFCGESNNSNGVIYTNTNPWRIIDLLLTRIDQSEIDVLNSVQETVFQYNTLTATVSSKLIVPSQLTGSVIIGGVTFSIVDYQKMIQSALSNLNIDTEYMWCLGSVYQHNVAAKYSGQLPQGSQQFLTIIDSTASDLLPVGVYGFIK